MVGDNLIPALHSDIIFKCNIADVGKPEEILGYKWKHNRTDITDQHNTTFIGYNTTILNIHYLTFVKGGLYSCHILTSIGWTPLKYAAKYQFETWCKYIYHFTIIVLCIFWLYM